MVSSLSSIPASPPSPWPSLGPSVGAPSTHLSPLSGVPSSAGACCPCPLVTWWLFFFYSSWRGFLLFATSSSLTSPSPSPRSGILPSSGTYPCAGGPDSGAVVDRDVPWLATPVSTRGVPCPILAGSFPSARAAYEVSSVSTNFPLGWLAAHLS